MSEQRALVAVDRHGEIAELRRADEWDQERVEFVRRNFCGGAPDGQAAAFIGICKRRGLAPEERQVYLVERGRGNWIIQTGIDGYRLIAERTGRYAGSDDPVYDTEDRPQPGKATVTVWKLVDGGRYPFTASARWREYAPDPPTNVWKGKPYLMLAKCAEALALRKAFPAELSALYTAEEMDQSDPPPPTATDAGARPRPLPQPEPEPRRTGQPRPQAPQPEPGPVPESQEELPLRWILRLEELADALPVIDSDRLAAADLKRVRMEVMRRVVRRVSGEESRKYLTREQAEAVARDLTTLKARLEDEGGGIDPAPIVGDRRADPETGEIAAAAAGLPQVDAEPVEIDGEAGDDRFTGR